MKTPEDQAKEIFTRRAGFYTTSTTHRDQALLSHIVEIAAPQSHWRLLDVATGTGHTAFAFGHYIPNVLACDLTLAMLREARQHMPPELLCPPSLFLNDVHALPYNSSVFDLVTCRRAAHHFSNIDLAMQEMMRVLRPGGVFILDDRSVPGDPLVDEMMNDLDRLHDPSHIEQYSLSRWREICRVHSLEINLTEPYIQHRPLSSLTEGVTPEARDKIHAIISSFTPSQVRKFHLQERDGQIYTNHWYLLLGATKLGK